MKIKEIEFIFENCQSVKYDYDKFKFFDSNNKEVHFRLDNVNIHRLKEYQDISSIDITYENNSKKRVDVEWEDNFNDNLYQYINYSDYNKGTIEITISKEKYLHKEIRETKCEINKLNEKLKNLNKQIKHE